MFLLKGRRLLAALLLVLLVPVMAVPSAALDVEAPEPYASRILSACVRDGDRAEAEVTRLLAEMEKKDPEQAKLWENILNNWAWTCNEMEIGGDVLPDGLPEDDSLCILVFGFCLNPNGSAKPELVDRLNTALRSAEKYPNAYILCTGGATSADDTVTEAGVMAAWLASNGVAGERILQENASMSTTENAQNSYALLLDYPQIQHVALVSSDYHIRRCSLMFSTVSLYAEACGGRPIDIVGNAVCHWEGQSDEGVYTQAWGLAFITGVDWMELPPIIREEPYPTE